MIGRQSPGQLTEISLVTCTLPWKIAVQPQSQRTPHQRRKTAERQLQNSCLRLARRASHRLRGLCQRVHAPSTLGRAQLELLNQKGDIDTELLRRLHLSPRRWVLQALDHPNEFGPGQLTQGGHCFSLTLPGSSESRSSEDHGRMRFLVLTSKATSTELPKILLQPSEWTRRSIVA